MRQESQANDEIRQQLLDLRKKTKGFNKLREGDLDPERSERAVVDSHLKGNLLRKGDFPIDVLPFVYRMIHPAARPINSQLLNTHEKESLRTSIEVMVLFDIRLTEAPSSSQPGVPITDSAYANFTPDIAKLVIFESSRLTRRLPMQLRT